MRLQKISIHALREEGDQESLAQSSKGTEFLSTPSARRATQRENAADWWTVISIHALREEGDRGLAKNPLPGVISIHALREEGDLFSFLRCGSGLNFYPRPPRGGRRRLVHTPEAKVTFLSTPSARRATVTCQQKSCKGKNFYPRPPRGGRPNPAEKIKSLCTDFYPRPPRGGRLYRYLRKKKIIKISIHALREEGD